MTDERILALLKQRDEQGILLLQEQYGGYCYSILYSLLRDEEAAHYGGAFAPFILTVDRLGWVCYLPVKLGIICFLLLVEVKYFI